jgi:hypothetical protein
MLIEGVGGEGGWRGGGGWLLAGNHDMRPENPCLPMVSSLLQVSLQQRVDDTACNGVLGFNSDSTAVSKQGEGVAIVSENEKVSCGLT